MLDEDNVTTDQAGMCWSDWVDCASKASVAHRQQSRLLLYLDGLA